MVQYIYFVKCPNCEDEPFDFFDEAKNFALGCMSKKPIITQIEVCRNDFGECTDSNDLGTVWSWEDMMADTEPTKSTFTKDDLKPWMDEDPEFATLDNSVDFAPEIPEVSTIDTVPNNFRKPIPADMTIESLVEEMEENEDMVECKVCNDLYPKEDCHYETDMGYLCPTCKNGIKSRGETLTFTEDVSLNEAFVYTFKYLRYNPDAKQAIYQELNTHPETYQYVSGYTLDVPLVVSDTDLSTGKLLPNNAGKIVDFNINGGQIDFTLVDKRGSSYTQDFKTLVGRVFKNRNASMQRPSPTYDFLVAFCEIVKQVNINSNLGISGNRDFDATAALTPDIAAEFKAVTGGFKFITTDRNTYEEEDFIDFAEEEVGSDENATIKQINAAETLAAQTANKVNGIYNSFFNTDFAKNVPAEMIERRPALKEVNGKLELNDKTLSRIIDFWGLEGILYLKPGKTVGDLSEKAREYALTCKIDTGKGKKMQNSDTSIISYRLCKALIQYFDNDVQFYKDTDTNEDLTEASLSDIVSIANDEYGTDYTEQDVLDAAEVDDLGYYANIETQNEINAEAQCNRRRRQAYAIAQAYANKNTNNQTVTESVTKERVNKMTKSELRTMIREMLHEELSLKEEIKEIVDEDGIFSSLNRAVMDNLCDIVICRRKGAPTNSNDDDYYKSDNWISTVPTNRLHGQRKEMDNGLTTRFTYLLASGIPKDVDPTEKDDIKKGLAKLRNFYPENQYKDNRIKYEHKVYTETNGDTQALYYSVLLIPNYREGYQLQSRDFPSLLRGQAEGPNYWKNVASQKRR